MLERAGSALCFSALIFAAVAAAQQRWIDVAVLMLVGLGQVITFLELRNGYARGACSSVMLAAGLSASAQLYSRIPGWDLLIHFVCVHVLVWIVWNHALRRIPRASRASPARRTLFCTAVGVVLAVVWEVMEFLGYHWVTPEIHIAPLDTIGDIVVGVLGGALVAVHTRAR